MRNRSLLALAVLAALALVLALWAIGKAPSPPDEAPDAPKPPSAPKQPPPARATSPVPAPEFIAVAAPPPLVRPPADDGTMRVPLVSAAKIVWVPLIATSHPTPGISVIVRGTAVGRSKRAWDGLLRAAIVLAVDGLPAAPVGVRVDMDVGDLPPAPEHLAAVALAVRLALSEQPWPGVTVITAFPAPDGLLLPVKGSPYGASQLARQGYATDTSPTIDALFTRYGAPGLTPAWSCNEGVSTKLVDRRDLDPLIPDPSRLSREVERVVGGLAAGAPIDARRSAELSRVLATTDGLLQAAPTASFDQLVTVALAGAEMRAAGRVVTLVDERLPELAKRLGPRADGASGASPIRGAGLAGAAERGRAPTRPTGPRATGLGDATVQWVTSLVEARVLAEARFMGFARVVAALPRAGASTADRFEDELRRRERALDDLSLGLEALLEWTVGRARGLPQPYPLSDVWLLAEQSRSERPTRNTLVDFGEATRRLGRIWSTLAARVALNPETHPGDPSGSLVVDRAALEPLLRRAAENALRCSARAPQRGGVIPTEIRRLAEVIGDRRLVGNTRIDGLVDAWRASVVVHEVHGLAAVVASREPVR